MPGFKVGDRVIVSGGTGIIVELNPGRGPDVLFDGETQDSFFVPASQIEVIDQPVKVGDIVDYKALDELPIGSVILVAGGGVLGRAGYGSAAGWYRPGGVGGYPADVVAGWSPKVLHIGGQS